MINLVSGRGTYHKKSSSLTANELSLRAGLFQLLFRQFLNRQSAVCFQSLNLYLTAVEKFSRKNLSHKIRFETYVRRLKRIKTASFSLLPTIYSIRMCVQKKTTGIRTNVLSLILWIYKSCSCSITKPLLFLPKVHILCISISLRVQACQSNIII